MWRHNVKTFRRMREVVGNRTRMRWRVEIAELSFEVERL